MRKLIKIADIAIDRAFNHNVSIEGVSKWYTSGPSYIKLTCSDGTVFTAHLHTIADARVFVKNVNKHLSAMRKNVVKEN